MKKLATCLIALVLPSRIAVALLRLLGYRIGNGVRLGFSALLVDTLQLDDHCRIGHLNLIKARRLLLGPSAAIGRQNLVHGPLSLRLRQSASIGNRNRVVRAPSPTVVNWGAQLRLERGAIITSDHMVDCTRSVVLGEYSILAGSGTQIWTHAYVHAQRGPGRYRLDGKVDIGHNVYVGSRCIVSLAVRIAPGCTVGAGAVVAKSLDQAGLYVNAPLRHLPVPLDPDARPELEQARAASLCETVYFKRTGRS